MMQHVSIIHSHISLYFLSCSFEALVEREWLHAGHPFQARCSRSAFSPSSRNGEAPTFLVFLDCVWQVWHQFPQSFEFNEDFLLLLLQHSYASQFGKAVRHYLRLHPFVVISSRVLYLLLLLLPQELSYVILTWKDNRCSSNTEPCHCGE